MKLPSIIFSLFSLFAFAQTNQNLVDSLKFVSEVPYVCRVSHLAEIEQNPMLAIGCGDIIFWRAVQCKEKIISQLILKLSDTTQTNALVPNFGGHYTVADVSYTVLSEIIEGIPTFQLLGTKFDRNGCGYCSYWSHLHKSIRNRQDFQREISKWYQHNQGNLIWVSSDIVLTCDCALKHPNGGHFELTKYSTRT